MALNCVKAAVVCGVSKRQNIGIPCPCLSPSPRSWGATKARPDQARYSATLGPSVGVREPHPGSLSKSHLVLAPTPSPPTWASAQSRADRELQAGMPVDPCLSVLG